MIHASLYIRLSILVLLFSRERIMVWILSEGWFLKLRAGVQGAWRPILCHPLCPVSQEIIVLSFFLSLSGCVCPKRFSTSLLKHPDLDSPGLIPEKNHKTVCPQPWTVILQRKFISASGKWCIFSHLRSIDVGAVASWLVHMLRRIELWCSCGHHEIKSTF